MTRTPASLAPAGQVLPVTAIASRFPALARAYEGQPVAYFDGPGGTQVPREVVDAMTDYLLHHNANTHWHFPTSLETDQLLDDARRALADFLNAAPSEIAFGNNMTTLAFHVGRALGRGWGPGDEIVVTELDHHANVAPGRPWRGNAASPCGGSDATRRRGQLDWDDFETGGDPADAAGRHRRRQQRHRHHQRRRPRGGPGARRGRARLRRCGALRAACAGRRPRVGLRSAGVLGLQVLRPARRRAVRPARSAGVARRPQAPAGARHRARTAGDRHAESRGHRRRRRRREVSGVAGASRRPASRCRVAPRSSGCLRSCTRGGRR